MSSCYRITLISKGSSVISFFRKSLKKYGFIYDAKHPDIVVSYGGDGTLLHAERLYPGVPKLLLRNSKTCRRCHHHSFERALDMIKGRRFVEEKLIKLEAVVRRRGKGAVKLIALNDIIVRNRFLEHAIRFCLKVNGEVRQGLLIGDGVVVATPFGSEAYFHSITGKSFKKGIGIAFNNVSSMTKSRVVAEDSIIGITIIRGPADIAADNRRLPFALSEGDTVIVRKSRETAALILP